LRILQIQPKTYFLVGYFIAGWLNSAEFNRAQEQQSGREVSGRADGPIPQYPGSQTGAGETQEDKEVER
jgi:hypothetical protein